MSVRRDQEDEIVAALKERLPDLFITAEALPSSAEDLEEIDAKAAANAKGAIFVSCGPTRYDEPRGNIYFPYSTYYLFIYSKDRRSHNDIYEYLETAIDAMYSIHYRLFEDDPGLPVKNRKTGLYRAVLVVGKKSQYPTKTVV